MQYIETFFRLKENKTNLRTEFSAALTTFMAMAYIIVVNPGILSETGMPFGSVLVATCLGAAIGCFLMAFLANYPFALAPGMGLNAFFTYTVCLTMGVSWKVALTAVFVEGVIFILLTLTNVRQQIVNSIPSALKLGIAAGIGLFIAFIGLKSAGIVVSSPATFVTLGSMHSVPALLAMAGFLFMVVLKLLNFRGFILWGIIATTIVGIPFGVTKMPVSFLSAPPSLSPIFWQMDFTMLTNINFWVIVFAFFFVDFFDTIGTLVGCASHANMLNAKGELPKAGPALMSDAVATVFGAALGTSTVTTYVESSTGINQGGRTGLVAFFVGVFFLLSCFLNPIVSIIPSCATAPALILVGCHMVSGLNKLDFGDFTESIPAIVSMFMMPFSYSISVGIEFGIVTYTVLKVATGHGKDLHWIMYVLTLVFILNYALN